MGFKVRHKISHIVQYMIPVLCMVTVILVLRQILFIGYVPTASMEPTIKQNSFIIGNRRFGEIKKGDIVIFEKGDKVLVKRIMKVSGEIVTIGNELFTVPDNSFFVIGDNLNESFDSRFWDDPFVTKEQILARVYVYK